MKVAEASNNFFGKNKVAYWLYFFCAFGVDWKSYNWALNFPAIASATLAGLLVLKAAQHNPSGQGDNSGE